ncbi:tellurite resistance TerB family protein [Streptomyces sp. NBC_01803]|uniref:tellurite resistance TerB family protein n=1 Tax=Streptomyces sp. NBC_01803 TaxID=2975946 RepID=UPI002DDB001F|nr:tellurite resistance TerB family protein [Streptomyces sp. NBC_01803]WSA45207.1 tellurite resistance TerB family protein [Streptomyces sp. NBC_01803]
MAMWDRIKDSAKGLQSRGGGHPPGSRSHGAGGGTKAQLVSTLKTQLTAVKAELKSGAFRDASMAMCALVAAADGTIDAAERQRVESLIMSNDVLQNFPPDSLRQRFNKHADQLASNFQSGRAEVMQEIAKVRKKPMEARAVVQMGVVIAAADGYFAQAEQHVIREVCTVLGVSPTEFDL